jgi:hypothetical protein
MRLIKPDRTELQREWWCCELCFRFCYHRHVDAAAGGISTVQATAPDAAHRCEACELVR